MENMEMDRMQEASHEEIAALLEEIEGKQKRYDSLDFKEKVDLTEDEHNEFRNLKKELEELRLKLAKLQNKN